MHFHLLVDLPFSPPKLKKPQIVWQVPFSIWFLHSPQTISKSFSNSLVTRHEERGQRIGRQLRQVTVLHGMRINERSTEQLPGNYAKFQYIPGLKVYLLLRKSWRSLQGRGGVVVRPVRPTLFIHKVRGFFWLPFQFAKVKICIVIFDQSLLGTMCEDWVRCA